MHTHTHEQYTHSTHTRSFCWFLVERPLFVCFFFLCRRLLCCNFSSCSKITNLAILFSYYLFVNL